MQKKKVGIALVAVLAMAVATQVQAQGRGSLPVPPLPEEPVEYRTAEHDMRLTVLARGLENPWSLVFLPDDSILITERPGRIRHYRDGQLSDPLPGMPEVQSNFISGLHDIKLHPDFEQNRLVYFVYNRPASGRSQLTVARAVFDGSALSNVENIISPEGASTVSRMLLLPDGTLLVSTWGEPGEMAQDTMGLSGKILRYNDDGSVPDDNPFVGREDYRPEIYTLGHRTPESLVWHEPTGEIWQSEMGPHGGDEVNILEPGGNYGWPYVSSASCGSSVERVRS